MSRETLCACVVLLAMMCMSANANEEKVGQWRRYSVSFHNESWKATNPFDVRLDGVFSSPSGRTLTQPGFYAGENTWKIFFMPDETGEWSFVTRSPDPELDGREGTFTCVDSDLPGPLRPDGSRWKLQEGGADLPVIWPPPQKDRWWAFRAAEPDDGLVERQLRFADRTVRARVLGIGDLVVAPRDWAADVPQDALPYVEGQEGERFYLPFWDRLNAKLDMARERGLGLYVMFFTDDALTPDHLGITPRSKAERRLFRYAVARLACYPIVLWDTGIDIGEYRNEAWIDWFAGWFNQHDPWHHPVGSRSSGGSGGKHPDEATYFSSGLPTMAGRSDLLRLRKRPEPTAFTDHWRPFIGRGNWTGRKLRVVHWRCGLSGGQATFPDYSQGFTGDASRDEMQVGAEDIGHAVRFFREALRGAYGALKPHDELIQEGDHAILSANPGHEYVVYDEDGGELTLDLSGAEGTLRARWYNPRTGEATDAGRVPAEDRCTFTSPTHGTDWVLHLYRPRGEDAAR